MVPFHSFDAAGILVCFHDNPTANIIMDSEADSFLLGL